MCNYVLLRTNCVLLRASNLLLRVNYVLFQVSGSKKGFHHLFPKDDTEGGFFEGMGQVVKTGRRGIGPLVIPSRAPSNIIAFILLGNK